MEKIYPLGSLEINFDIDKSEKTVFSKENCDLLSQKLDSLFIDLLNSNELDCIVVTETCWRNGCFIQEFKLGLKIATDCTIINDFKQIREGLVKICFLLNSSKLKIRFESNEDSNKILYIEVIDINTPNGEHSIEKDTVIKKLKVLKLDIVPYIDKSILEKLTTD